MRRLAFAQAETVLSVALLALSLAFGQPAKAAVEDPAGYAGALFGLAVPSLSNTSARPTWGLQAGAKIGSEIGLGGYYMTSSKDETINGVSGAFGFDLYGVQLGYHFEGEARGAFFGGRLGMSKVSQTVQGSNVSTSPYHFGLVGGYDWFFMDHFSVGGEASYMAVGQADATTASGASVKNDAFNVLNFVATAKFWF